LPNSTSIRSVPADTRVREEQINNWSRLGGFQGVDGRRDLHEVGACAGDEVYGFHFLASISMNKPCPGNTNRKRRRGQIRVAIDSNQPRWRCPTSDSSKSPWVSTVEILTSANVLNNVRASSTV
jgi:hypothetical protein